MVAHSFLSKEGQGIWRTEGLLSKVLARPKRSRVS
jgi:hypothetical protein